jgi:hypothetical protein
MVFVIAILSRLINVLAVSRKSILPTINSRTRSSSQEVKILWLVTMKETMPIDPKGAFTIDFTEIVKVELPNQGLKP